MLWMLAPLCRRWFVGCVVMWVGLGVGTPVVADDVVPLWFRWSDGEYKCPPGPDWIEMYVGDGGEFGLVCLQWKIQPKLFRYPNGVPQGGETIYQVRVTGQDKTRPDFAEVLEPTDDPEPTWRQGRRFDFRVVPEGVEPPLLPFFDVPADTAFYPHWTASCVECPQATVNEESAESAVYILIGVAVGLACVKLLAGVVRSWFQ